MRKNLLQGIAAIRCKTRNTGSDKACFAPASSGRRCLLFALAVTVHFGVGSSIEYINYSIVALKRVLVDVGDPLPERLCVQPLSIYGPDLQT